MYTLFPIDLHYQTAKQLGHTLIGGFFPVEDKAEIYIESDRHYYIIKDCQLLLLYFHLK